MEFEKIRKEEALDYHSRERRGKIEVIATKPLTTSRDLSLAYTPGVAEPCREIEKDPGLSFKYTARANLVAVITNGTAVLGLGDIGAEAAKPVMEGKGVLFKKFADIDVFDIEINTKDPEEFVNIVTKLEPTFGGINLEDIKAPECFYIEEQLKKRMKIPVFHDDQHGTAIISAAAFINALELVQKDPSEVKIVFSGAGAAAIACARLYLKLGAKKENIFMFDSKGLITVNRTEGMNPYKAEFAQDCQPMTMSEALEGADMFVGLSVKGMLTKDMIRKMAKNPIVFAMANPDPEITYEEAIEARDDVIMATGRSDYPNQVNNVLGFPYIFRGALDVMATTINDEMKLAASKALARLAREPVPESVSQAYQNKKFSFGREYLIPKPFDPRVLTWVAPAVARAAMETGVARIKIEDFDQYVEHLKKLQGESSRVMRKIINIAKQSPKRVAFAQGKEEKILRACQVCLDEKICTPVLIGDRDLIRRKISELNLDLGDIPIVDPWHSEKTDKFAQRLYELRARNGITLRQARKLVRSSIYFGLMLLESGEVDGFVSGLGLSYPETIRPALQIIKPMDGVKRVSATYIMIQKDKVKFFADATMNIEPTTEDLVEITLNTVKFAKDFGIKPRVAMLSFSNFGSVDHPLTRKVKRAVQMVKERMPDLIIDGEMQADTALVPSIIKNNFPFSVLQDEANILIFPDLTSCNIAYKILNRLGGAIAIGPILLGMKKPVDVLQMDSSVNDIVYMASISVMKAQELAKLIDKI